MDDVETDDDRCGLCGQPGADKVAHPRYWPGETVPDGQFVHAQCEREECERAHSEFVRRVGLDGVREFLNSVKGVCNE